MISVIIPMYNASHFIQQCVNSALSQSYGDMEIIVIDDHSIDNSIEIVTSVYKNEKRVKLIQQGNNLGAGAARNKALKIAQGEYIFFLDSDDYISDMEALEKLYELAIATDSDLVYFKHYLLDPETEIRSDMISPYEQDFWLKIDNKKVIKKNELLLIPAYPWTKLFKREFLINNNINCTETFCHNDFALTIKSILITDKISYLPESFVMHRHAKSFKQTTNLKSKRRLDLFKATADVNQFLKDNDISVELHSYYLQCKLDLFTWATTRISLKYKRTFFNMMQKDLKGTPKSIWNLTMVKFPKTRKEIIKLYLIRKVPLFYTLLYMLFSKEARNK